MIKEISRGQRIQANCKIIWGADKDFDLEIETDDHVYYQILVREDRGLGWGPTLTFTPVYRGSEFAWDALDDMLRRSARRVESKRRDAAAAAAAAATGAGVKEA